MSREVFQDMRKMRGEIRPCGKMRLREKETA